MIEDSDIYMDRITHFIQHPLAIKNKKLDEIERMVMPVYLTDKEKKRINRNKRLQKEKDK